MKSSKQRLILCVLAAILIGGALGWVYWQQTRYRKIDHTYPILSSPNCDLRPLGQEINCVVLHATAQGTMEQALRTFRIRKTHVSAHYVVGKNGTVIQMVPIEYRAWHAGVSRLGDEFNINNCSVGIEMVNRNDGNDPYPDAQYFAVAKIIHLLRTQCAIPNDRIVSHSVIALPKGRKSDPRGFDFRKLRRLLKHLDKSDTPKKHASFFSTFAG